MGILSWIVVGLIAGWLAGLVMRGGYSILGDIIIGIVGALVGGFIASSLFNIPNPLSGINLPTIFVSFLGAVLMIALLRMLGGRRSVL
ncbi:MAG TPA: GlsB/YeaQ/YmgE family stress response membrane protein [Anaerolineaceae bacterium]|nr:GlsB/YeaQ/YmgE family stress response membrane protein [Anaerolineaceae bacterium]